MSCSSSSVSPFSSITSLCGHSHLADSGSLFSNAQESGDQFVRHPFAPSCSEVISSICILFVPSDNDNNSKKYQRMSRNLELINGGTGEERSPAAFKQDTCLTLLNKARKVEPRSLLTWLTASLHQVHVGTIPFNRGPSATSLLLRQTKTLLCWSRRHLTNQIDWFEGTLTLGQIFNHFLAFVYFLISWQFHCTI